MSKHPRLFLVTDEMGRVAEFRGITVSLHALDHNPPHLHARYREHHAAVRIDDGMVIKGALPPKQFREVYAWAATHRPALREAWERARLGLAPGRIAETKQPEVLRSLQTTPDRVAKLATPGIAMEL